MNVIRRRGWEIPERVAMPEHLFFNRRSFLVRGARAMALMRHTASAHRVTDLANLSDPTADLIRPSATANMSRASTKAWKAASACGRECMIPKSGNRFSDKIMRKKNSRTVSAISVSVASLYGRAGG
jgi:hypothetical protein